MCVQVFNKLQELYNTLFILLRIRGECAVSLPNDCNSERTTFCNMKKLSLTRDFRLQAFFVNQFPWAHEYPIGAYSTIKG